MLLQLSAAVVVNFLNLLIHCHAFFCKQGPKKLQDCKTACAGKVEIAFAAGPALC